jgi:hypothetical protein
MFAVARRMRFRVSSSKQIRPTTDTWRLAMSLKLKTVVSTLLVLVALAPTALLAETIYSAVLLPGLVVPPSTESAYGTATLIVADDGLHAAYTVNFAGLEGAQTAAFLMAAPEGTNGATLLDLPLGTPIAGIIAMTPALASALADSSLALQINSTDWPTGVLRGNFHWVTVAAEETTWSAVKALFE